MPISKGWNPSEATASIKAVQSAYGDLMKVLIFDMQSQFVSPMGDYWACQEAVDFFGNFETAINSIIRGANKTCGSIISSMNSAASSWAQSQKETWASIYFAAVEGQISVDMIKTEINGDKGVDDTNASSTVGKLATLKSAADGHLTKLSSAVDNCGFLGGGQAEALKSSVNKIKSDLDKAIGELTDAANKGITATVEAYGSLATNVQNAFHGE